MSEGVVYKAVIFDFGGVLMSYCKPIPAWAKLEEEYGLEEGIIQKKMHAIFKNQPGIDEDIFLGKKSAEELEEIILPEYLSKELGVDLPRPLPVLNLWMGPDAIIPMNQEMVSTVKKLKELGFHTSILTNNYVLDREGIVDRTPIDKSLFTEIVESTRVQMMKPHREIYELTQSLIPSSISPNQCIFLDDNKENIKAAQDWGWATIFVNPHNINGAIDDLKRLLQIPSL